MVYTNDEKQVIIENLKKVQNYAETELIPKLRENEVVTGRFGKMTFSVRWDGDIIFSDSGFYLQFDKEKYPGNNIYNRLLYGAKLLANWKMLKYVVTEKIREMEAEREAVLNFEV